MSSTFVSQLYNASRHIDLYIEARCATLGLNPIEGHLLLYLLTYSPVSVSLIHKTFAIKRSSLTSIFDRLVARGWVSRRPAPRDRRLVLVELTAAGRERANRLQDTIAGLERRIGEQVNTDQLRGFVAVLSAISDISGSGPEVL